MSDKTQKTESNGCTCDERARAYQYHVSGCPAYDGPPKRESTQDHEAHGYELRVDDPDTRIAWAAVTIAAMRPVVEAALNHRPNCYHTASLHGNATCRQLGSQTPCAACAFNAATDAYRGASDER